MALEPFATADDLAARLGVAPYSGDEKAQVDALLDDASDELRFAIGQPINRLTSTVTLWADRDGRVDLPAWPVVEIVSVEIDSVDVDPSAYTLRYRTLNLPMVCRGDEVIVSYTHGWDPVPGVLKRWACVLAASVKAGAEKTGSLGMVAGIGQHSIAIDDYQESFQGPASAGADPSTGMTVPDRLAEQLRAQFGGGSAYWVRTDE